MNYKEEARLARLKVLDLIFQAQTSHLGSNFSCIDILTVLFDKIDLDKDKFVLSAGWKAASLYYFLWKKGRITEEQLNSFCKEGSKFIGLSEPLGIFGLEFAGGSMSMGLAAGVGFALAKKIKKEEGIVYVLESDGGMQGGIAWEAVQIASQYKLDNLVLIIDDNKLQAMGKTEEILSQANLKERLESFGWSVLEIDGHNFEEIEESLKLNPPRVIIAHTIKGKGVSFMENNNEWHYRAPEKWEYEKALKELNESK